MAIFQNEDIPELTNRPPVVGKNKSVRRDSLVSYHETLSDAFPYMYDLEVSRFMQLMFHRLAKTLHEKKTIVIPFFGTFSVKPVKQYRIFRNDIQNGYSEWVDLKEPITDWVPVFKPSAYLKHLTANRFAQRAARRINHKRDVGTTEYWDKVFMKYMKRDETLKDCPYSLLTFGWSGYRYKRILKESIHRGETVLLTASDGEVYQLKDLDGNHDEKFKVAYKKYKKYVEEVAKRRIYKLRKRTNLKKVWNTIYTTYLNEERSDEVKEVQEERAYRQSIGLATTAFYVLKFGFGFEIGEFRKVFMGYIFNPFE